MIRGHIDFVSRTRVEGWILGEGVPLAGATVLAFVDEACVGAGTVDVFRQDLVDAGLGDGIAGFGFSIWLEPWQDARILDIRLDGGNALIKQTSTCLLPREDVGEDRRRAGRDPASLSWMLGRGWLTQQQYDGLRVLAQFGIYEQFLQLATVDRHDPACCDEVALIAGELLELQAMAVIDLEIREGIGFSDLAEIRKTLRAEFPWVPPVVGLWGPRANRLSWSEGSHLHAPTEGSDGAIEYEFGGDHLLLLNLDGRVSLLTGGVTSPFVAFVPRRAAD